MRARTIQNLLIFFLFVAAFVSAFISELVWGNLIIYVRYTYFNIAMTGFVGAIIMLGLTRLGNYRVACNVVDIVVFCFFFFVFCNYIYRGLLVTNSFMAFMLLPVLYFLTKVEFTQERYLKKIILLAFLLTGFFVTMQGFMQLMTLWAPHNGLFRVTGSFLNPGPFSIYLISFFPISLSIVLFIKAEQPIDYIIKYVAGIDIFFILLILPQTESRTSWIAVSMSAVMIFAIRYNVREKIVPWFNPARNKIIAGSFLIVIAIVAGLLYKMKEESVNGRVFIWKTAIGVFTKNPFLGSGFNTIKREYNERQAEYFANHPLKYNEISLANQVNYVFNDYLQILLEEGAIGLVIFLFLIGSLIYTSIPVLGNNQISPFTRMIMIGSFSSLCLLLITSLFSYSLETLPTAINFIFFAGLISSFSLNKFSFPSHKKVQQYGFATLGVTITIVCMVICTKEITVYASFHEITTTRDIDRLKTFKENHEFLKNEPSCMLQYGKLLASHNYHKESINILTTTSKFLCDTSLYRSLGDSYRALGNHKEAQFSYLKSVHIAPHRFLPRYYLVKSYLESGDTINALAMADYIVRLPVKIDAPIVYQIKDEMKELIHNSKGL